MARFPICGLIVLVFQGPAQAGSFLSLLLAEKKICQRPAFHGPGRSRLQSLQICVSTMCICVHPSVQGGFSGFHFPTNPFQTVSPNSRKNVLRLQEGVLFAQWVRSGL